MRALSVRLLFALVLAIPAASSAQIILTIGIAPPPLPVYVQPVCPSDGYLWTPGYWAYAQQGYFWVPGTWVTAPQPGFLWTPGYWGWNDSAFVFNQGYWGTQVGFYGGVNYGFGYGGVGFEGGEWRNGAFFYNRSVSNVTNIKNVYTKAVNNATANPVSYNGGEGGISARPNAQEQAAASQRHIPPTSEQTKPVEAASTSHQLYESVNHGKPAVAATAKPGEFSGKGVVAAKAAAPSYKPATARAAAPAAGKKAPAAAKESAARPATAVHPSDPKLAARPASKNGEQVAKNKAPAATKQKAEPKHPQQTQQVAQNHEEAAGQAARGPETAAGQARH